METFSKFMILLFLGSFLFIVIVEGAGTTLKGDTLSFNIGTIKNIDTIDTVGHPLFIVDSDKSTVIAMFNADPFVPIQTAQSLIVNFSFPNTTTSFLGDVNNFDNINGTSRFKENNLNNGSGAVSALTVENDVGKSANFGIGSSGFMVGNKNRSSQPAIVSFSEQGFNFVNFLGGNWSWVNNPTGDPDNTTREEVMNLSGGGNLEITGNFTGNQFYGEMSSFHVLSPQIIPIPSLIIINESGIFNLVKITNWTAGENNGFTFFNDSLIVGVAGIYNAKFGVTYANAPQGRHVIMITNNGVGITKTAGAGYVANANDIRSVTGVGLIRLEMGDILEIKVGDRFSPVTSIEVLSNSFDLIRIGN